MPSSRDRDAVRHMLLHASEAIEFIDGFTLPRFIADRRTFHAVTRCIEIVSEASRRLDPETRARRPDLPWRAIADTGNIYRHEYDGVAPGLVWDTAVDHLPAVIAFARAELA